jgi:integrase
MLWENYRDGEIFIARSIWHGHVTEPKTKASKAAIPVVPYLAAMLERHRLRVGNPSSGPLFAASNGKPMSLNNALTRIIKPALALAKQQWRGWHAFRRGLSTNLHHLKVPDKTIQSILRHENVATTQKHYILNVAADTVTAMNALEAELCAERAPISPAAIQ